MCLYCDHDRKSCDGRLSARSIVHNNIITLGDENKFAFILITKYFQTKKYWFNGFEFLKNIISSIDMPVRH